MVWRRVRRTIAHDAATVRGTDQGEGGWLGVGTALVATRNMNRNVVAPGLEDRFNNRSQR